MLRIRIKDDALRFKAVIELLERQFKINVTNKDGDCLYVWTDGNKRCDIQHWTNDNPIQDIDNSNFRWFINSL